MYEISCNWGQYIDIEENVRELIKFRYVPPKNIEPIEEEYDAYDYFQNNFQEEYEDEDDEEVGYNKENVNNTQKKINSKIDKIYLIKVGSQTIISVALAYLILFML